MGWSDNHTKITEDRVNKLIKLGKVKTVEDSCPYCHLPIVMCKAWGFKVMSMLEGGRYY